MLPGVSPLVYSRFLLLNTVFLSLMDMGKDLPEYEEIPIGLTMLPDVEQEYQCLSELFRYQICANHKNAKKLLSAYLNTLTIYPDQPYGIPLCWTMRANHWSFPKTDPSQRNCTKRI